MLEHLMNWINNVVRPKIRNMLDKREVPENLWIKCPRTGELVFPQAIVEANQLVVPEFRLSHAHERRRAAQLDFFDDGRLRDHPAARCAARSAASFRDERRYTDRLKDARTKTGLTDAVHGRRRPGRRRAGSSPPCRISISWAARSAWPPAKRSSPAWRRAASASTPFVMFAASGGARMQEGILSLMQMPRTTVARAALREAKLPYIVVLTNPTTGGVTASYAMLGDIHIAEPGALIGFAGPRVIEQTIREKLPEGFQRAEYLHAHGMVDMVVHSPRAPADDRPALPRCSAEAGRRPSRGRPSRRNPIGAGLPARARGVSHRAAATTPALSEAVMDDADNPRAAVPAASEARSTFRWSAHAAAARRRWAIPSGASRR